MNFVILILLRMNFLNHKIHYILEDSVFLKGCLTAYC